MKEAGAWSTGSGLLPETGPRAGAGFQESGAGWRPFVGKGSGRRVPSSPKRVQNRTGDPGVREAGVPRWAGVYNSINKETGQLIPGTRGWWEDC